MKTTHIAVVVNPTTLTKILVSRRDAAALMSVSQRAIDYLIADGRIASRRVGGRVLIPLRALEAFAAQDHTALSSLRTH